MNYRPLLATLSYSERGVIQTVLGALIVIVFFLCVFAVSCIFDRWNSTRSPLLMDRSWPIRMLFECFDTGVGYYLGVFITSAIFAAIYYLENL